MTLYRVEFYRQDSGIYEIEAKSAKEAGDIANYRYDNEEIPSYSNIGGGMQIVSISKVNRPIIDNSPMPPTGRLTT